MADGAARALSESLRALRASPRDKAAVQLARRYAALLDAAAVPSAYRAALARLTALATAKADIAALDKVRDALGAHTVASDLGPKYLAVLAQLGLTPAARSAKAAANVAEPEPAVVPKPEGKRDDLKSRREARTRAAGPR
jgi:hypothetical protein